MSLYNQGKKINTVYHKGKEVKAIFREGNFLYLKEYCPGFDLRAMLLAKQISSIHLNKYPTLNNISEIDFFSLIDVSQKINPLANGKFDLDNPLGINFFSNYMILQDKNCKYALRINKKQFLDMWKNKDKTTPSPISLLDIYSNKHYMVDLAIYRGMGYQALVVVSNNTVIDHINHILFVPTEESIIDKNGYKNNFVDLISLLSR